MLTHIKGVLDPQQLAAAHQLIAAGKYTDGSTSAGMAARRVKHNEELALDPAQMSDLNNLVMNSLVQNPVYRSAAMPLRIAAPYYAHYTKGMSYGEHVDDPIMGMGAELYRSDVSITIFLNSPDAYDGGELVIQTAFGEQQVKLPAGDAVIYPSSSLHHINEVSAGERLVAVTWTQSMLRDPQQRELAYQLYQAREHLLQTSPDAEATTQIDHAYVNLVRMWSEL